MHTFNLTSDKFANSIIDWLNNTLPRIPGVVLSILVGVLVVRLLIRLTRFLLKLTSVPKGLRQIIASAIEMFMWFLLSVSALQWLGFPNILVFLSSSTLAIGIVLAAGGSTLFSDLVAGVFLARDSDFNVGDEIKAGENQTQGIIVSMDVRRVRLRDADGQLHVLPNSLVERKEWVVIRRNHEVTTLMKTANKLKSVALETKAAVVQKKARLRKNSQ